MHAFASFFLQHALSFIVSLFAKEGCSSSMSSIRKKQNCKVWFFRSSTIWLRNFEKKPPVGIPRMIRVKVATDFYDLYITGQIIKFCFEKKLDQTFGSICRRDISLWTQIFFSKPKILGFFSLSLSKQVFTGWSKWKNLFKSI